MSPPLVISQLSGDKEILERNARLFLSQDMKFLGSGEEVSLVNCCSCSLCSIIVLIVSCSKLRGFTYLILWYYCHFIEELRGRIEYNPSMGLNRLVESQLSSVCLMSNQGSDNLWLHCVLCHRYWLQCRVSIKGALVNCPPSSSLKLSGREPICLMHV